MLRLLGSASTLQAIAEELGLDRDETVRAKEAMRKLGFTSRLQVVNDVRSHSTSATD